VIFLKWLLFFWPLLDVISFSSCLCFQAVFIFSPHWEILNLLLAFLVTSMETSWLWWDLFPAVILFIIQLSMNICTLPTSRWVPKHTFTGFNVYSWHGVLRMEVMAT
jgi:hypothetical protein